MTDLLEERFNQEESLPEESPKSPEEEKLSNELYGLLGVGKLSKEIDVQGNSVVLRTLTIGEELEVGLLVKDYKETSEEPRSYATAVVAASVENVNGKQLVERLGPNDKDFLERKFKYVRDNYYWPIIQQIYYEGYIPLLEEQLKVFEELRSK